MHVYRFRILSEDIEDFYRDIEISANGTFEDLHKAILKAVDFDGKELASFYISDSKWNRRKEIALIDMSEESDNENAPLIMSKCKLAEYIDDPHQRMIYVYDFLNMYEFYIELSKIVPAEKGVKYPRCIRQSGAIPKEGTPIPSHAPSMIEENEIFVEDEDNLKEDEDADLLGFYSDTEATGGFTEESGENFEND